MLIRIFKGKKTYPYSQQQLRIDTGAMFEQQIAIDVLAAYGVYPVVPVPQPAYNPQLEEIVELEPEKLEDGTWRQVWQVRQLYATQAERDVVMQAELVRLQGQWADQIDNAVAVACARPQRFTEEYKRREAQARAYVAQYDAIPKRPGIEVPLPEAPKLIAGFAQSSGLNAYEAARLTVAQADALYDKLDRLANLRMRKYEVKRATTIGDARVAFEVVMAAIGAVAATIT